MLFPFGQLLATPASLDAFRDANQIPAPFLLRHQAGDWGDLDEEDKAANERSLVHGGRILSAYHTSQGVTFWIITEHDRSATTILLPDEY